MSQENVEVAKRLITAANERHVDRYLALCTPDSLYDFAGAEIRRVQIFLDRAEALQAAGLQG